MGIIGAETMSEAQLAASLQAGGKLVVYEYCISLVVITFRRNSPVHYIAPGADAVAPGWKYTLLSLLLGWWGFPFGLVFTPLSVINNLRGGRNINEPEKATW
jgi:hypothetical protein